MKKYILFICIFVSTVLSAQVGINTTDPHAQLEIKSTDQANPANTDGILIPKVDAFPAINPTIDQDGMLVYLTNDVGANFKGFYYWDNTNSVWKSISGDKGWSLTGNAGTDVATNFIGTTDNVNLVFKRNNIKSGLISYENTSFGNNTLSTDTLIFGYYAGKGNTAFGGYTLASNTTGDGNAAFGENALNYNTIGTSNTGVGKSALASNISGSGNSAFGYGSLLTNISGLNNTGLGYRTLWNTISNNNTAIGSTSMYENTTGSDNVAVGNQSLYKNLTGINNVAVGSGALMNNKVSNNVAVGKDALFSNTSGTLNSAFGISALFSNTVGVSNIAIGYQTLYSNTTGSGNFACGFNTLFHNTTGYCNFASGDEALEYNTTGSNNIANGYNALHFNTTGTSNIANGFMALINNSTGISNSAFGYQTMHNNTVGNYNIAIGEKSLIFNQTGSNNIANGNKALYFNYSGTGNGGYGEEANPTTTTGWNNIGIGFHTLGQIDASLVRIYGNEIGYDNIAFGLVAGDRIGNNCNQSAFIGPFSNVITNGTNVSNSTAIGNGALVFQNNMMRLGNSAVTRIESQVGLTVVSDGRYKFNVKEEVKGLDFIKKLRPVVYQYDTEKMDREWMNVEFDTMVKHNPQILKDYQKASQIRYSGFIAQEVEAASQALNYNFSGISKPENADGHYGLDYASFVVPLVKAVQEQQEIITTQNSKIEQANKQFEALKNQNKLLEERLNKLEQLLNK